MVGTKAVIVDFDTEEAEMKMMRLCLLDVRQAVPLFMGGNGGRCAFRPACVQPNHIKLLRLLQSFCQLLKGLLQAR